MRVLVVSALAATLVACSTSPHMPIDHTPRMRSTLRVLHHRVIPGTKRKPAYHKRDSGNTKTAINAMKVEPHSSDLDDKSAEGKVREVIAAKLGNPASIKFPDIAPGKAVHTFCGVAEVTGASGEATELPFVYLARRNETYIIDGSDNLRASTAIHKMCD